MSNEEQYIVTCRFPSWKQGDNEYPPFGVKYLIKTPIITEPDWPEDDERWISWSPDDDIVAEFKKQYTVAIGGEFKGEILFIEPTSLVTLGAKS